MGENMIKEQAKKSLCLVSGLEIEWKTVEKEYKGLKPDALLVKHNGKIIFEIVETIDGTIHLNTFERLRCIPVTKLPTGEVRRKP